MAKSYSEEMYQEAVKMYRSLCALAECRGDLVDEDRSLVTRRLRMQMRYYDFLNNLPRELKSKLEQDLDIPDFDEATLALI